MCRTCGTTEDTQLTTALIVSRMTITLSFVYPRQHSGFCFCRFLIYTALLILLMCGIWCGAVAAICCLITTPVVAVTVATIDAIGAPLCRFVAFCMLHFPFTRYRCSHVPRVQGVEGHPHPWRGAPTRGMCQRRQMRPQDGEVQLLRSL